MLPLKLFGLRRLKSLGTLNPQLPLKMTTILIAPGDRGPSKKIILPSFAIKGLLAFNALFCLSIGYISFDYIKLRKLRHSYRAIKLENQGLRGEALQLIAELDEVKKNLGRVQSYSEKLFDITQLKVKRISKKTGIDVAPSALVPGSKANPGSNASSGAPSLSTLASTPALASQQGHQAQSFLGLDLSKLVFKAAFDRLEAVGEEADQNALRLKRLISELTLHKSLLASVPSLSPVEGWVTSGFGGRTSPFTGEKDVHMGIDIAAPIGSPIYAPADGVVIYAGVKEGFGNFIMLAHGYGVISRFGHNSENLVVPGQKVQRGEHIASVGMSGNSTGPHCHYEILVNGQNVDPSRFILADI